MYRPDMTFAARFWDNLRIFRIVPPSLSLVIYFMTGLLMTYAFGGFEGAERVIERRGRQVGPCAAERALLEETARQRGVTTLDLAGSAAAAPYEACRAGQEVGS